MVVAYKNRRRDRGITFLGRQRKKTSRRRRPFFEILERRLMLTDVSGAVEGVWDLEGSPYRLVGNTTVEEGKTLTIEPGVQVTTSLYGGYYTYIYDFTVDGTLNVADASFTDYTELIVRDGGTLNMTEATLSGGNVSRGNSRVEFRAGASGQMTDSTFNIPVHQYSGSKASPLVSFSDNTFTDAYPVYTYGALVEEFYDNVFHSSGGRSRFVIQGGTLTEDSAWEVVGTASRYLINDHFTVASGTTLSIGENAEVWTSRYSSGVLYSNSRIYRFDVRGTVNATGAAFVGYTDLNVREGGTLNLTDTTVSGGDVRYEDSSVEFRAGSMGQESSIRSSCYP